MDNREGQTPGRNFGLTPPLSDFIDSQVVRGRHQNASEAVLEALRRYEAQTQREQRWLDRMSGIAARGIADIEAGHFFEIETEGDTDAFWAKVDQISDQQLVERERKKAG